MDPTASMTASEVRSPTEDTPFGTELLPRRKSERDARRRTGGRSVATANQRNQRPVSSASQYVPGSQVEDTYNNDAFGRRNGNYSINSTSPAKRSACSPARPLQTAVTYSAVPSAGRTAATALRLYGQQRRLLIDGRCDGSTLFRPVAGSLLQIKELPANANTG